MEELTLQLSYLVPFISFSCMCCFKSFPMIKYTYVPSLKVAMLCVFALCGLIVFMTYWAMAYSEPCKTPKMELFTKYLPPRRYPPCLVV